MNPVTLAIGLLLLLVSPQTGATSSMPEFAIHPPESAEARSLQPTPAWTFDGNQDSAMLSGLATAGDVNGDGYSDVLVSSALYENGQVDEGKVWLFLGSAAGLSTTPAWTAEGDQAGAYFGNLLATAGDVNGDGFDDVLIGASSYDNGQTDEGRVFLYLGSASGLSSTPAWTAEGNQAGAVFGYAVATAGDVNGDGYDDVIIGAQRYDNGQADEGRAFVYLGGASGLASTSAWTGESNVAGAYYGLSVASAGDVNADGLDDIIVGAPGQEKAYVYLGTPTGVNATPIWTATGDAGVNSFGQSVSAIGDFDGDGYGDVVVGAPTYSNPEVNEGKIYYYKGSASGLSATTADTFESNQAGASLGYSVSLAGATGGSGFADLIVGARGFSNGQASEGRAYLFRGYFYGTLTASEWAPEGDQAGAGFGGRVACAGDVDGDGLGDVLVAAPNYDAGQTNEGRAYLYRGMTRNPNDFNGWTRDSYQVGAKFGKSVAFAGDVNGDGFTDVIFGASSYDNTQVNAGRVELFHSRVGLFGTLPSWTGEGDQANAAYGQSVAGAGDVNGDGYDDIVIGAPGAANPLPGEGRVYVHYGSATGVSDEPSWTYSGGQAGAAFGWSVASAGDVNGDGFGDLIVGAYNYDAGETNEGRAFLFLGSASGLGSAPAWTAEGNQAQAYFGYSVASAGDVNGDGYGEVIVGIPGFTNGPTGGGAVSLYRGSADGLSAAPAWGAQSLQLGAEFGKSVAGAGDVNGDGYGDLVIGAPMYDNTQVDEGRVTVYLGRNTGPETLPAWTRYAGQAGAQMGFSVASAGDLNGDGFSDIVMGSVYYDHTVADEGAAFMYPGTATGPAASPGWAMYGLSAAANFGASVAGAGDASGDGFGDLLVGAPGYAGGGTTGGRVLFYSGNGSQGLDRAPVQRRANDTANIGLMGMSESNNSFRLGVRGRTPAGRGLVRMAWEVKPLGVPFDGSNVVLGDLTDTGVPSVSLGSYAALGSLCGGLSAETGYRWRLRVLTDSPFFPGSPWITHPGNPVTAIDLRTAGVPSAVDGSLGGHPAAPFLRVTPNPLRGSADLTFSLRVPGPVHVDLFDAQGRRVASLVHERMEAGSHSITWDGRDGQGRLPESGVYFVRCVTPEGVRSASVVVSR